METTERPTPPEAAPPAEPRRRSRMATAMVVLLTIVLTLIVAGGVTWWYLPGEFRPVRLTAAEEARVEEKLARIGIDDERRYGDDGRIEPYREPPADRRVRFTEREINGLIARDDDMGRWLQVGFSDGLVTARMAIRLDADLPVMGGRIVKVAAGLELSYRDGRPVVVVRGVSFMGVPLPNAWLGNIKGIDLVDQYGDEGFWHAFAAGVEELHVRDGVIEVTLRE